MPRQERRPRAQAIAPDDQVVLEEGYVFPASPERVSRFVQVRSQERWRQQPHIRVLPPHLSRRTTCLHAQRETPSVPKPSPPCGPEVILPSEPIHSRQGQHSQGSSHPLSHDPRNAEPIHPPEQSPQLKQKLLFHHAEQPT